MGLSARALSQSARAAGYAPLAADLFCDLDTQEAAERSVRIDGDLERGLEWPPLAAALERLAAGREPIGVVCGSGFEDRPDLLDRIGGALAAPRQFRRDGRAGKGSREPGGALRSDAAFPIRDGARRRRARAGSRSRSAAPADRTSAADASGGRRYWQERVDGRAGLGARARRRQLAPSCSGFSAQWPDPSPTRAIPLRRRSAPADCRRREPRHALMDAATRALPRPRGSSA